MPLHASPTQGSSWWPCLFQGPFSEGCTWKRFPPTLELHHFHPPPHTQAAKCFYYLQHLKRKIDSHFVSLEMGVEDRDLVSLTLLWGLLQGALATRDTVGRRVPYSTTQCSVGQPAAPGTNMGIGIRSWKEGSVCPTGLPELGGDERQRRGQANLAKRLYYRILRSWSSLVL